MVRRTHRRGRWTDRGDEKSLLADGIRGVWDRNSASADRNVRRDFGPDVPFFGPDVPFFGPRSEVFRSSVPRFTLFVSVPGLYPPAPRRSAVRARRRLPLIETDAPMDACLPQ